MEETKGVLAIPIGHRFYFQRTKGRNGNILGEDMHKPYIVGQLMCISCKERHS